MPSQRRPGIKKLALDALLGQTMTWWQGLLRPPLPVPLPPALLRKRSLELDWQPQLYKRLGMYVWQMSHLGDVVAFSSARSYDRPRGLRAPLVTVHRLHWNSCHHRSPRSSFTAQPGNRNHPFPSSLGCSPRAPPKTLPTRSRRPRSDPDQIASRRGRWNFPRSYSNKEDILLLRFPLGKE